jgi:hypothetical protein
VNQVLNSIFTQLSTFSLAELKIDKPDDVSWKNADGFHFQLLAYTLLGVYDIACSYFVERLVLADPDAVTVTAVYVAHIMDCHTKLQEMLSSASRTKRLKGMISASTPLFPHASTPAHRCVYTSR